MRRSRLEARDDVAGVLLVANSPSSAPVRRDVPAISGVARQNALGDLHLTIRFRQRRSARREVVEHERALVHLGKKPVPTKR